MPSEETHRLDQVAANHHVRTVEPERESFVKQRFLISVGALGNEPRELDQTIAHDRVVAVQAVRQRLAIKDLVLDCLVDERAIVLGRRRASGLLDPPRTELSHSRSREHDRPTLGARLGRHAWRMPRAGGEKQPADQEKMKSGPTGDLLQKYILTNCRPS